MSLKSVVVTVESEYLQAVAKLRGISRTRLVQMLMEKLVRDKLAEELVTAADVTAIVRPQYYRRFKTRVG